MKILVNGNKSSEYFTATPEKYPQKRFNDKSCRWCGIIFKPIAPSHLYCSDDCAGHAFENRYFTKNYGLTSDQVRQMISDQDNGCAICGSTGFKLQKNAQFHLVLDHDHKTGNPRGMLCHNCNRGLGLFQDDIGFLKSAIEYLEGATTISKESTLK